MRDSFKITVFSLLVGFYGCELDLSFNPSGSDLYRCMVKDGGEWELRITEDYTLYGEQENILFTKDLGVVGSYQFTDEDAPIPGRIATFYDADGNEEERIIQATTPDEAITVAEYVLDPGFSQGDYIRGYVVQEGFNKESMIWTDSESRGGDTIVHLTYHFDNLGN